MTQQPEVHGNVRPLTVASIMFSGILASGFLGATTNAINGAISPTYYITILHWENVENIWRAVIAQGIFEGLLFGTLFSLLFTVGTGIITRASCSYIFAIEHLLGIIGATYVCWAFGGLAAIGLAILSPEFYRQTFYGVPEEFSSMLRYAWVGGSIWGEEFGGFVSVVVGLVILRANWRNQIERKLNDPVAT